MFSESMVEGWTPTAVASDVQIPILNTPITEAGNNEVGKGNLLSLIAILCCIVDYIWKELNPKRLVTPVSNFS